MTTPHSHSPTLLKPAKPVGIIGYGATNPLSLWEIAKHSEGEVRVREYHGRSAEQVAEIFKQVGLTSKFWYL